MLGAAVVRRSRQRQARPSTMTLTPMYPAPTPERCSSVDYLRTWMQASLHVLGQCVLCTHVYVCSLCGCVRLQCVWEFLCVVANIYSSNVQCICVQCVNVVGEVGVTAIVHFPVQMISSGTSFSLGTFWWTGLTKPELEHCSLPKVTTSLLLTPPSPLLSPPSPLCITSVITPHCRICLFAVQTGSRNTQAPPGLSSARWEVFCFPLEYFPQGQEGACLAELTCEGTLCTLAPLPRSQIRTLCLYTAGASATLVHCRQRIQAPSWAGT